MASNLDLSKTEYTIEEQQIIKNFTKSAKLFGITGNSITILVLYIVYSYEINLSPNTTAKDLIEFSSKLIFVFQNLTLGMTWLLISVYFVIRIRVFSIAMNPMFG